MDAMSQEKKILKRKHALEFVVKCYLGVSPVEPTESERGDPPWVEGGTKLNDGTKANNTTRKQVWASYTLFPVQCVQRLVRYCMGSCNCKVFLAINNFPLCGLNFFK